MIDLLEKIEERANNLYDVYRIKIRYKYKHMGAIPKKLDTMISMVEARVRAGKLPKEVADRILEEARTHFEKVEEEGPDEEKGEVDAVAKNWVGYWEDEEGIFFEARTVKSAIRECCSKLGIFTKERGSKGAHDYGFFVEPYQLRFERYGKPVTEPDGYLDMPCIISDAKGKRATIRRSDYVEGADVSFDLYRVANGKLTEEHLISALALMQKAGNGGQRSQGFGQFTILECKKVKEGAGWVKKDKKKK